MMTTTAERPPSDGTSGRDPGALDHRLSGSDAPRERNGGGT